MMDFFFTGDRDYWRDPVAASRSKDKGAVEARRRKAPRHLQNRARSREPAWPTSCRLPELPIVWVHTKDVQITDSPLSPLETRLGDWAWK